MLWSGWHPCRGGASNLLDVLSGVVVCFPDRRSTAATTQLLYVTFPVRMFNAKGTRGLCVVSFTMQRATCCLRCSQIRVCRVKRSVSDTVSMCACAWALQVVRTLSGLRYSWITVVVLRHGRRLPSQGTSHNHSSSMGVAVTAGERWLCGRW